jgi:DNA-directed RNA polymerase subunit alpha
MLEKNWRDLIKPRALDVDKDSLTNTYGKFIAKPLERGFGLTLGNSIRRVLLSSLQGAAVTAARFEGVVHEFSTLPQVKEDVAEIILNLKEVRFQMYAETAMVRIDVKGPRQVTAADISTTESIGVLNPDQLIATLGENAHLVVDLKVSKGRGYVSAENNRSDELGLGWVALDSFYSPIRRVNYVVTQSRVGQRTDYDKLTLEIWTDGSIAPEESVALSSKILKDQLSVFLHFEAEPEPKASARDEKTDQFNAHLYRSVEELELSVRSANCLQNANIRYIYELVQKTESDMLKTKNFGRKSLTEIKEILHTMGLSLGMNLDGFVAPEGAQTEAKVLKYGDEEEEVEGPVEVVEEKEEV